jgi:hypothetical protein
VLLFSPSNRCTPHISVTSPFSHNQVFRTYNASVTLDRLLFEEPAALSDAMSVDEKKAAYDKANKEVAILCNHQRSVPKTHTNQVRARDSGWVVGGVGVCVTRILSYGARMYFKACIVQRTCFQSVQPKHQIVQIVAPHGWQEALGTLFGLFELPMNLLQAVWMVGLTLRWRS